MDLIIQQTRSLERGEVEWFLQGLADAWGTPVSLDSSLAVRTLMLTSSEAVREYGTPDPVWVFGTEWPQGRVPILDFFSVRHVLLPFCCSHICSIALVLKTIITCYIFKTLKQWKSHLQRWAQSKQLLSLKPSELPLCVSALLKGLIVFEMIFGGSF